MEGKRDRSKSPDQPGEKPGFLLEGSSTKREKEKKSKQVKNEEKCVLCGKGKGTRGVKKTRASVSGSNLGQEVKANGSSKE